MAKYGSFKYGQQLYGLGTIIPPVPGVQFLPPHDKITISVDASDINGITSIYVDGNETIQNNPFTIGDKASTTANKTLGAEELSTIAMGEQADQTTAVSMEIQGLVKITIPLAGSRFFRG